VNPVPSTSHLQVAQEGLQFLESIDKPVAPIVVIGPYRSGKSFLLNQLLGVPCSRCLCAYVSCHVSTSTLSSSTNILFQSCSIVRTEPCSVDA
jgi:hypothetical protein